MTRFFAHPGSKPYPNCIDWQSLACHLRGVSRLAASHAERVGWRGVDIGASAVAAGLLHDFGKYRPAFQEIRLIQDRPGNEDTWHKNAGVAQAQRLRMNDVAFAIAGHHGGMPDAHEVRQLGRHPAGARAADDIWSDATADCHELLDLREPDLTAEDMQSLSREFDLRTRVLFSCLVDADWEDTRGHERAVRGLPREVPPPPLEPAPKLETLLAFIETRSEHCSRQWLAELRSRILRAALAAAELHTGLFSMTVPTGGGKTLSGLAFALAHAAKHGLDRVIYVAPYLSIVEQNASVIREALGLEGDSDVVFEHHSLAEPTGGTDHESHQRQRLSENWAAPIVLTTTVQFFESLFSNQPGRCRKLHRIARSVVILDECQTLPAGLIGPTCAMLSDWARWTPASFLLMTATQPAWEHGPHFRDGLTGLQGVREVAPADLDLFRSLRRVRVTWPAVGEDWSWDDVAARMASEAAILTVVNSKRAAREIVEALRSRDTPDVFHLSTAMCPAHRLRVIETIRERLRGGCPCRVVSTQLIEAGVDLDFPVVFRELGPLEGIIQAAGRCNREGRRNAEDGTPGGIVVVFRSRAYVEDPVGNLPLDCWYRDATEIVNTCVAHNRPPNIDDPAAIRAYFGELYHGGDLDKADIQRHRDPQHPRFEKAFRFATVAEAYQLIDDDTEAVVVATWSSAETAAESVLDRVRRDPSRRNLRALNPFTVNLRRQQRSRYEQHLAELAPDLPVLVWHGAYDDTLGLSFGAVEYIV